MANRLALAALLPLVLCACRDAFDTPPQNPAPRRIASTGHRLVSVGFLEALKIRVDLQGQLRSAVGADVSAIQTVLYGMGVSEIQPLFDIPPDRLEALYADVRRLSGREPADLLSWHRIVVPDGVDLDVVIDSLSKRPEIAYVYPAPVMDPPPPVTPDFSPNQNNYFGPAPSGTDAVYARGLAGGRGAGIKLVDVEYDWNFDHEDLALPASTLITGERSAAYGNDHGTAVLGELVGRDNGFGVVGGVPEATIRVAGVHFGGIRNVAQAIANSSTQMAAGDVMLIEQQQDMDGDTSTHNDLVPVEWVQEVFIAISNATNGGRIVVETAGNGGPAGGLNLDDPMFEGKFDRNQRDSRAVFVGGGTDNNSYGTGNYGSRVDLQAQASGVTTTGIGDLYGISQGLSPNQYYTGGFSGTSAAGPIIAAAATTIQGFRKHLGRSVLTPDALLDLLRSTGSPQTGDLTKNIGPKPNLRAAIETINTAPVSATLSGPVSSVGHNSTCSWTANVTGGTPPYTYSWNATTSTPSTGFFIMSGQGTPNATTWGYNYSNQNSVPVIVYVSGQDAVGDPYSLQRTVWLTISPTGCY